MWYSPRVHWQSTSIVRRRTPKRGLQALLLLLGLCKAGKSADWGGNEPAPSIQGHRGYNGLKKKQAWYKPGRAQEMPGSLSQGGRCWSRGWLKAKTTTRNEGCKIYNLHKVMCRWKRKWTFFVHALVSAEVWFPRAWQHWVAWKQIFRLNRHWI